MIGDFFKKIAFSKISMIFLTCEILGCEIWHLQKLAYCSYNYHKTINSPSMTVTKYTFKDEDNLHWLIKGDLLSFSTCLSPHPTDLIELKTEGTFYFVKNRDFVETLDMTYQNTCYLSKSISDFYPWFDQGGVYALCEDASIEEYKSLLNCMALDTKRSVILNSFITLNDITLPFSFTLRHFEDSGKATRLLYACFYTLTDKDIITPVHELLLNAIEHGHLNLKASEKSELYKSGQIYNELSHRLNSPQNYFKEVMVTFDLVQKEDSQAIIIKIEDQGEGFDPTIQPPTQATALHGRGIKIVKALTDDISYNQKGNAVTITILI
jgi:anti-sigma regulatory factor (Ser/Thr protein kinase)